MEIDIKPIDIDKLVKDKILESTIGKEIEECLKEIIDGKNHYGQKLIHKAFRDALGKEVDSMIQTDFKPIITKCAKELLEKQFTEEFMAKIMQKLFNYLKQEYESYLD